MLFRYLLDFELIKNNVACLNHKKGDVESLIAHCLEYQPREFKEEEIKIILVLARKIDVTKTVFNKYDKNWKKLNDSRNLREEAFSALLALLLIYVSYKKKNASIEIDLKILNSIFNGLNLIKYKRNKLSRYVEDRANTILDEILGNEIT